MNSMAQTAERGRKKKMRTTKNLLSVRDIVFVNIYLTVLYYKN
jgi:hypothetical protein